MSNFKKNPWSWIPSLYFTQGLPYVIVMTVSVIMYKRLGISNTDIALYTSWLYLPWVIKPLWSPIVDLFKTKRWWIITTQLIVGAGLAGVALAIPGPAFFKYTLIFFWLMAFSSATHDIAADGFYMLALDKGNQSYFIGIRSTFYRVAMITGQGLLIIIVGILETHSGLDPVSFSVTTQNAISSEFNFQPPQLDESAEELTFNYSSSDYILSTELINKDIADSLKNYASSNNIKHGFTTAEITKLENNESWLEQNFSKPLAEWLKSIVGKDVLNDEKSENNLQGGLTLVGIQLSKEPESPIVLNTDYIRGDASLKLIEGSRLEFNKENWTEVAWIAIQADSQLNRAVTTYFEGRSGDIPSAWRITFFGLSAFFIFIFLYHKFILPKPKADVPLITSSDQNIFKEFISTFGSFFSKKGIGLALMFILLFRLGEAQLVKLAAPFLLDSKASGGLGLTTGDIGLIYGTIGMIALTLGGILGGLLVSKRGLKYWIFPMTLAINIPNLAYVYLSYFRPESMWVISTAVGLEQFGYGFGFTSFMLYMMYFSEGKSKTAHYAICTGFMALGMMLPGMVSGWLQEIIGYENFFIWVMLCTTPGFIIVKYLKIDPNFGKKLSQEEKE